MALGISVKDIVEKSGNPLLGIHPSWRRIPLGDIANIINGFAFKSGQFNKSKLGVPLLRIRDIISTDTEVYYNGNYDDVYIIEKGDLIIGMDGDFNCAIWTGPRALLNQRVCKVELNSSSYNSKFLYYLLPGYLQAINDHTSSVTVKHLSSRTVSEIPLPLPPLLEQERLVNQVEELFSELEAGVAALDRVSVELKRYEASLLKAACEGRLSESRKAENFNELPEGWQWSSVAELAAEEKNSITDGPFGSKLKTEHYQKTGPRVIRLQNIGDGQFRDEKAHISREHFETLRKHQIFAGDLVIAGLGVSLPRACIIPEYVGDAIVKADCIRFKPNPELADNKYLLYALNSETVKKLSEKIVHGIGRPRMNQQEIKAIPIPLPPLKEQRRIVAEVERRLSVIREVESAVKANLLRAGRLRQAILTQAFEGKLVPQDPNEEPAEELLERILATRQIEIARVWIPRQQREKVEMSESNEHKSLFEVLKSVRGRLKPEELFSRAGFDEESIDEFYEELRTEIRNGRIKEIRPNKKDVFLEGVSS
jgi:type I restriction enzyme, S subunit